MATVRKLRLDARRLERLDAYRQRWAAVAADHSPCDREAAEAGIAEVYEGAGHSPPEQVLWVGSPWAAAGVLAELQERQQLHHRLTHIEGRVARYRLIDRVVDHVRDDVRRLVRLEDWTAVYGATALGTLDPIRRLLKRDLDRRLVLFAFGHQEADWLGAYDFLAAECGFRPAAALRPLMDLARHCGWWIPLNGAAIACERPERVRLKGEVLHSDRGPALRYRDGRELWALEGMRVPREAVTASPTELAVLWAEERNSAVRKLIENRLGVDPLFIDPSAAVIDRALVEVAGEHHPYALVRTRHRRGGGRRLALVMTNPSTGERHTEWVEPTLRSVHDALAWRNGTAEAPRALS